MKKHTIPRISQCMIVKNEEKNIETALSWGKGIVSEQIVVDTGSTDRTVEIAQKMGAKVYHFSWIDDFSAAKNYAISKARYEWIAFLDADEYLTPEDAKKLSDYVKKFHNTAYEGFLTRWINLDDDGEGIISMDTQIRVFRNMPALRYVGKIHEYLAVHSRSVKSIDIVGEVSIYHTGYQTAQRDKKAASERNFKLIQAELAENPENYEMHGYLGNEYEMRKEWKEAKECYEKAISLMPEQVKSQYSGLTSGFYLRLLELLAFLPDTEKTELENWYQRSVEIWPEDGDFDYIMGKYYGTHENYAAGEKHIRQALALLEKFGNVDRSARISGKLLDAYELLAICCGKNGRPQECVNLTAAVLKEDSYRKSTLIVLLSTLQKDMEISGKKEDGAREVAAFLGNSLYDLHTLKNRLFILRAAMETGYEELVEVMRGMFTVQELAIIDGALEKKHQESTSLRIILFYSEVESFNFFTDQLAEQLKKRNHEVFIFDLLLMNSSNPHLVQLEQFLVKKVDVVICFDGIGIRDSTSSLIKIWDKNQAVVVDILMDPPLRFHDTFEKPPQKYLLFCCDREHIAYVKKYFGKSVSNVNFMPHVGVRPKEDAIMIPYKKRTYDILFCGTYYRPEDKLSELKKLFHGKNDICLLYEEMFSNLKKDSSLTIEQALLMTLKQLGGPVSEEMLKIMLRCSEWVDWAIRMYMRGEVVDTLGKAGLNLYLLGRGWENHPVSTYDNVHRIDDRIPYKDTLSYMANARINLNVMPWFKEGTHDRIFNTLLQHSLPLTDSSTWIDENFTDGVDIALYDLKHLEKLPDIARGFLEDSSRAEMIIENGYQKCLKFTWSDCTDWILEAIKKNQ